MSDPLVNPEAEAGLLGSLMSNNAMIDYVADIVSHEDFATPVLGRVFSAIVREASLGRPANPVTIKGYFDGDEGLQELGGLPFLARLTSSEASMMMDAAESARHIVDLAKRRSMRAGLEEAAKACTDLSTPTVEIVSHADAAISVTAKDIINQPTGAQCFDELLDGFGKPLEGVQCGVIPELDELLGPMRPKQLVIAAGRPGMGKTALALSYSLGAARKGHGVMYVTLEMSSVELAARMAADLCFNGTDGVPYSAIRDGNPNNYQARKVAEAASYMHGLPFQVVDTGSLTVGRLNMLIRRHARRMEAAGRKLELVVVDYLQLLSPDSKGRSNYEAVSEISRALKAMAKDHGIAILALAQLSRSVENRDDKSPQLSDLRDSGQIEQDADAVLFLLRQEYYLNWEAPENRDADWQMAMEAERGKIDFILAKRRNGETGRSKGNFYGVYQAVRGERA